ncbi:MAG: hypothetical protein EA384_09455 [Spirochaetaceae bacterium]|nr:MAG: hypothetical protein EA384_09455 [Spirochaetaceae bacterium]
MILPAGYNRNRSYPVFVLLPPTGVDASRVTSRLGLDAARQREFVLILPAGSPSRDDYLPDFLTFVAWYEERLLQDLDYVLHNYSTDPRRVYLGGYSLGGDLSWALSVRNPYLFAGAVMAGTRASHPVTSEALDVLRETGFRGAFLIGDREDPDRYRGINSARVRFEEAGIEHRYREYPGGHIMPQAQLFQQKILYVTAVQRLPDPAPRTPLRPAAPGLLTHTSRDRIAVRVAFPAEISSDGITPPSEYELGIRVEWPWSHHYVRTTADYSNSRRTTGKREQRVHQDVLFGTGSASGFFGAGVGWDWVRQFSEGNSYGEVDLLLMRADRNPWIVPAGSVDPRRVDSLLLLRYTIPRGIGAGVTAEQLLNLRAEYLVRIADRVVLDAAVGCYTVQNRPVESLSELSRALDQRLEWGLGFGIRAPSPLLWRVSHLGTAERPLTDGEFAYRGVWKLSLEFSL